LISSFCRVLNGVCIPLGNSLASEFYMPTFRNTLRVLTRLWRWNRHCVQKHWHIKFRRQWITQKKAYNM